MARSKKSGKPQVRDESVTTAEADTVDENRPDQAGGQAGKITIDGVDYDASQLSDAAKGAIASLQFADARIMALRNELAVCQTAKIAYVRSLKAELEGQSANG